MKERKEVLAYHEAGHFVVNQLLQNVKFPIILDAKFPDATEIWINSNEGEGSVNNCSLPIEVWTIEQANAFTNYFFERSRHFSKYPKITIGFLFGKLAGYVAESLIEPGEIVLKGDDHKKTNDISPYIWPHMIIKSDDNRIYEKQPENKLDSAIKDLKKFFGKKEIAEAIKLTVDAILEQKEDNEKQSMNEEKVKREIRDFLRYKLRLSTFSNFFFEKPEIAESIDSIVQQGLTIQKQNSRSGFRYVSGEDLTTLKLEVQKLIAPNVKAFDRLLKKHTPKKKIV